MQQEQKDRLNESPNAYGLGKTAVGLGVYGIGAHRLANWETYSPRQVAEFLAHAKANDLNMDAIRRSLNIKTPEQLQKMTIPEITERILKNESLRPTGIFGKPTRIGTVQSLLNHTPPSKPSLIPQSLKHRIPGGTSSIFTKGRNYRAAGAWGGAALGAAFLADTLMGRNATVAAQENAERILDILTRMANGE